MESFIETSQMGGSSKPKPALAPKPCLAPKPFSLQSNSRFRSISAPKPVTAPKSTEKSEASSVPKTTVTKPAPNPAQEKSAPVPKPSSTSEGTNESPKTTKENKNITSNVDSTDSSEAPGTTQTTPAKTSRPPPKEDVIQTNQKAPSNTETLQHNDVKRTGDDTKVSPVQKNEESVSRDSLLADTKFTRGGTRNRLSMELTSKFESGGLSLPPQPNITVSAPAKEDNTVSNLEQSQTNTEQPKTENHTNELTEECSGGGSIKRRISLLFDSSSRPEVITKREEPEVIGQINGSGGVKERIKNWVAETASENKPQVSARPRSKSFEPTTAPSTEKTPKPSPPAECPTAETISSNGAPSRASTSRHSESPPEPTKETIPIENILESSLKTPEPQEQDRTSQTTTDDKPETEVERRKNAPKRDNVKRRSVRFGVVERDDGGPPIILGSDPSSEEEAASEDESEENITASVPVYRRAGLLQRKDNETEQQEEERLKHLEFEQRRNAEKNEERLKLEEEMKQKEVYEKEQREAEERLRNEEREKRKQNEEQCRKDRERLEKELHEQERNKKNMEQELERQKEEERERLRQIEEKLRLEAMEREKLRQQEEDRERERQRRLEEAMMREQEEQRRRKQQQEKEAEVERLRKIEIERKKEEERILKEQKEELERRRQEEERIQKERKEELERRRQEEERIQKEQKEELERRRQEERIQKEQKEELERRRQEEERIQKEQKEELERRRQEEERKQKEQKEELERRRQEERIQKAQKEELERRRQEEERIQKAQKEELERRRQEEERIQKEQKEELERRRQEEERKQKEQKEELERRRQEEVERNKEQNGATEGILISFHDEVQPQKTTSPTAAAAESRSPMDLVYDDFSVKKPLIEVDFDDFSVRPKRWGSQAKAETNPVQNWAAEPVEMEVGMLVPNRLEKVESVVPGDVRPRENKVADELREIFSTEPILLRYNPKEESVDEIEEVQEEEEEEEVEEVEEVEESVDEKEEEELEQEVDNHENYRDDTQEAQVNTQRHQDKDTDALIVHGPNKLQETNEQTPERDSPEPDPDQSLEVSFDNTDTTDTPTEEGFAPFPESTTPLLDTSAQRSKVELARRRSRIRAPRSVRIPKTERQDWRACDSTDGNETSSKQKEPDSDDEEPKPKIVCSAPSTSQRVSMFPGVNPAALIAQLKKRTGGDRSGETEETVVKTQEVKESPNEEIAPSSLQPSRSPRSAAHLAGAALVLPPLGSSSGGAVSSPAWLKELKSKKRMGQYDGET